MFSFYFPSNTRRGFHWFFLSDAVMIQIDFYHETVSAKLNGILLKFGIESSAEP